MHQTRVTVDARHHRMRLNAGHFAGRIGGSGVLPIVHALKTCDLAQIHDRGFFALGIIDQHAVDHVDAAVHAFFRRDPDDHLFISLVKLVVNLRGQFIVNADHGCARLGLTTKNFTLRGDVTIHAAVPLQMIGA